MKTHSNRFIWYELMSTDVAAAAAFYGEVVGWQIPREPQRSPDGKDYRMIACTDGGFVGGALQLDAHMVEHGARSAWLPYLYVPDVDAALRAMEADGAHPVLPAMDLPVGRIAMVADPAGAMFYVMTPRPPPGKADAKSTVFHPSAPQRVNWNELGSTDPARAKSFYAKHFGFSVDQSMPMGPMGDYVFLEHDGGAEGGLLRAETSGWVPYFGVPSVEVAQRRITQLGGTVTQALHEVPGGSFACVAVDAQGARFGVVGRR